MSGYQGPGEQTKVETDKGKTVMSTEEVEAEEKERELDGVRQNIGVSVCAGDYKRAILLYLMGIRGQHYSFQQTCVNKVFNDKQLMYLGKLANHICNGTAIPSIDESLFVLSSGEAALIDVRNFDVVFNHFLTEAILVWDARKRGMGVRKLETVIDISATPLAEYEPEEDKKQLEDYHKNKDHLYAIYTFCKIQARPLSFLQKLWFKWGFFYTEHEKYMAELCYSIINPTIAKPVSETLFRRALINTEDFDEVIKFFMGETVKGGIKSILKWFICICFVLGLCALFAFVLYAQLKLKD